MANALDLVFQPWGTIYPEVKPIVQFERLQYQTDMIVASEPGRYTTQQR